MASTQIEKVVQVADAPISKITVFKCNKAEVTRHLAVDLEAEGHYQIKLQGLPNSIESNTVGARAVGMCALQRVSYSEARIEKMEGGQAEELRAELAELKKRDAVLAAESARGKQLRQYIDTYAATTMGATGSSEEPGRPAGLGAVCEVLDFTQQTMANADSEAARLGEQRQIITDQMGAIKARLAAAEGTDGAASNTKLVRQAVVSCLHV
jgi:N-terminal domain of unknown function (DUF4140)